MHDQFGKAEFGAGIDAHQLRRPGFHRSAGQSAPAGELHDIGQIIFVLGVVVGKFVEKLEQNRSVHQHEPGIDQADLALGFAGVLGLDDAIEIAFGVQDQAAVSAAVLKPHAEHDDRGVRRLGAGGQQIPERLAGHQRRIGIDDQNVAGESG